jgi:hypothetical protein
MMTHHRILEIRRSSWAGSVLSFVSPLSPRFPASCQAMSLASAGLRTRATEPVTSRRETGFSPRRR